MEAHMFMPNCSKNNTIKNIRLTLGLNQQEFAEKISKDHTSISLYEAGKRMPSFKTIRKIVELANENGIDVKFTDIRDE